ncbi:MAG TPA: toxic anion resistance protein [Gryllotalpicola sp.]
MADASLDLSTPAPGAPTAAPAPAPAAVGGELVLTPPTPVPVVQPTQVGGMMPISETRAHELAARAADFLAGLAGIDARAPEFAQKVADVSAMGADDIRAAAAVSNRMLERPVAALEAARGRGDEADPQRKVAATLVELRLQIEDLDPSKQEQGGILRFLSDLVPFRDKIRGYFAKYASAQAQLNKILQSLQNGQDSLLKDNAAIEGEKTRLWDTMNRLQEYSVLVASLDAQLADRIAQLQASDPDQAKTLTSDLLFAVRQKHQDLLTQLAVSAQGYLALDVVRKNNLELIKGVDRASTTTISALRTAVIVAQALANQKLVLDQINALNETTSNLIVATSKMLKEQSADIAQQASSASVNVDSLQVAFQNIYDTIDQVDNYKAQAVQTMAQTVTALETQLGKAHDYLDRARPDGGASGAGA